MRNKSFIGALSLIIYLAICTPLFSQEPKHKTNGEEACSGPVFSNKDVSRKTQISYKPEPSYTKEARQNHVTGTVVLTIVLVKTAG